METWIGWGAGWTHPFFLQNLIPRLQLCCSDPLWLFGAREGGGVRVGAAGVGREEEAWSVNR